LHNYYINSTIAKIQIISYHRSMAKKSTTKNEKELPYSTVNNLLDKLSSLILYYSRSSYSRSFGYL